MSADRDRPPLTVDLPAESLPPLVAVRRWAATALADADDDQLHAVLMVCTELVSNAYEHAQTPYVLRMWRGHESRRVRIEVEDASPEPPVLGRSRLGDHRGRGLIIVDKLAEEWGVRPLERGKVVWALISCAG